MRQSARALYSSFNSIPTAERPLRSATTSVVPDPANGSSTVPFGGHPHRRHRSTSSAGNGAQCAYGFSGRARMVQMSSSPFKPARLKKYRGCLEKMNTFSWVRHGLSLAVGSPSALGLCQITELRSVHPFACIARATRQGNPIRDLRGNPSPGPSTARSFWRAICRALCFLSRPCGLPFAL